jgi:hypothetical protein
MFRQPETVGAAQRRRSRRRIVTLASGLAGIAGTVLVTQADAGRGGPDPAYVIVAYNDLGMHCMNEDFSELVILPPYNNLRAQIIRRGESPEVISEDDVHVTYRIPTNTRSSDKTNFWEFDLALFGVDLPPDVGLTGNGLAGEMARTPHRYYEATGIPITPIDDSGRFDPYPLATVSMTGPLGTAETRAVVPVSTEISCNLCHAAAGGQTTSHDILVDHDTLHGTDLVNRKPVLCASCHADPALGTPGLPGLSTLSSAIHTAHAPRMDMVELTNTCYACHPGLRTDCQRDVHLARGVNCTDCHGGMIEVGDPARVPWVDEPRCGTCHERPGFDFEPPGTLFKEATGHGGVLCSVCHGSPHAVTPAVTAVDNLQAQLLQGRAGVLDDCTVCHVQTPDEPFFHRREND